MVAFSSKYFSGKTSLPAIENSYLPAHLDDEAEILAVSISKFFWVLFCSILLLVVLFVSLKVIYNRFCLSLNGLSYGKVVSLTKNENAALVKSS